MKKEINTDLAPAAVGAYSQAVMINGFLFVSGQIPIDPLTGAMKTAAIEEQTKQVMDNIKVILNKAGLGPEDIIKTEIFLADINDFQAVNKIYQEELKCEIMPARCVVGVSGLPKGAGVEISCIAVSS